MVPIAGGHMLGPVTLDVWSAGDAYEAYVGRWSRPVANLFVPWLDVPAGRRWLDVGCGTGALAATLLARAQPATLVGVDRSTGFLATARAQVVQPQVSFHAADARALPLRDASVDVVVSGLAVNFVPEPARAVAEFVRVTRPGGTVAAYVWDYDQGMAMMRYFWDAAIAVVPGAAEWDEGRRFPVCSRDGLRGLWRDAGLCAVEARELRTDTVFADFDDFWRPFLGGQGAAPGYLATLPGSERDAIRDLLRSRLPAHPDGSIHLTAAAWAVRGGLAG